MSKIIELNTIQCGNCLTLLPKIPDNSIDLIVTSPPYNVEMKYDVYVDSVPWKEYYIWCEKWLLECLRVLKPDGRMALNHYLSLGNSKTGRTAPLMELNHIATNLGFKHHTVAVWTDRTLSIRTAWGSWMSSSCPYISSPFEGILILYKDSWKKLKKGISDCPKEDFIQLTGGIWKMQPETRGLTPANFCVDLPLKCIRLLSYVDSVILDPFIGSGTTAIACLMTGRKYIGMELSPEYCNIAAKRCQEIFIQNEIL
jgi:site-specific DNA-methyltransferase (adenine-specific)